ncbi:hypothetical protein [Priestia filamentosa]|uniref:hypothetical protein n=1 Tax=Priestia filamentosa TaxID=1402861 RepID=UPI0039824BA7
MKKIQFLTFLLFAGSLLIACSNKTIASESAKPTVKEILKEDSNADIIQLNATVYKAGVD